MVAFCKNVVQSSLLPGLKKEVVDKKNFSGDVAGQVGGYHLLQFEIYSTFIEASPVFIPLEETLNPAVPFSPSLLRSIIIALPLNNFTSGA